MISYLKGTILAKNTDYLIIENQGIGYKVFATPLLLSLNIGEWCEVFTYHKSTDDGQALFGLSDFESLRFFELMLSVNGVGPKTALSILSIAPVNTLENAISSGDAGFFSRVSGVGKKTAERIILELKSKIGSLDGVTIGANASDVYDALLALGYSTREARTASTRVDLSLSREEQLKAALKLLSK